VRLCVTSIGLQASTRLPTHAAIVKTTMKGLRRSLGAAQAKKAPISNVVAKRLVDSAPDVSLKGRGGSRSRAVTRSRRSQ
jgi:hypothetical protein